MSGQHETITVPRPEPDEAVIAVCDVNGAKAYVTVGKTTLQDGGFMAQVIPILGEAQHLLHEEREPVL